MNSKKSTWKQRGLIIVPGRFVDAEPLTFDTQLRGEFTLRKKNRYGRVIAEQTFENLILDGGLNRFGSSTAALYPLCYVGTGTVAPAATDTQLGAWVATSSSGASSAGAGVAPNYESYVQGVYTFVLGAVVGNMTEVGVGSSPTALWSRALILDGLGVPTSFPVAADEQLEVTYRLYQYPPMADVATTQLVGGTTYNVIIRPGKVTSTNFWGPRPASSSSYSQPAAQITNSTSGGTAYTGNKLDATSTANIAGTLGNTTSVTHVAYAGGTFYQDCAMIWNPSNGNGNIRTVLQNRGTTVWQIEYQTVIPKTATQTLTLPFRMAWARA